MMQSGANFILCVFLLLTTTGDPTATSKEKYIDGLTYTYM